MDLIIWSFDVLFVSIMQDPIKALMFKIYLFIATRDIYPMLF